MDRMGPGSRPKIKFRSRIAMRTKLELTQRISWRDLRREEDPAGGECIQNRYPNRLFQL